MTVKINALEIENIKRVKAVQIKPAKNGLTVIGGKNGQGKTSVLDAIAWGLGGNRFKPSNPKRDDSALPPELKIELDNGLIVERKGKNSDLKVTDPTGKRSGQTLLDSFVEQLALDLPRFLHSNDKEKADTLLQIIGVGDELHKLEEQEEKLYNQRRAHGQVTLQKQKYAEELESFPNAPNEFVSMSELLERHQNILAHNAENQRQRNELDDIKRDMASTEREIRMLKDRIDDLQQELNKQHNHRIDLADRLEIANKTVKELKDESTEEIEKNIASIEQINEQVRANREKLKAQAEAEEYQARYEAFTQEIEAVRDAKIRLLEGADLPLEGLSVEDGELIYQGQKWDGLASSEQLRVATAIVRKLNPSCGFVLIDKLEAMDLDTLEEFGRWLESEGLQAIATRVSTGDECTVIIEDGYIKENSPTQKKWKAGEF